MLTSSFGWKVYWLPQSKIKKYIYIRGSRETIHKLHKTRYAVQTQSLVIKWEATGLPRSHMVKLVALSRGKWAPLRPWCWGPWDRQQVWTHHSPQRCAWRSLFKPAFFTKAKEDQTLLKCPSLGGWHTYLSRHAMGSLNHAMKCHYLTRC